MQWKNQDPRLCLLLVVLLLATQLWAQDASPGPGPSTNDIPQLIQRLGHAKFRERERAVNQLRSFGTQAFYPLLASQNSVDAEIRARVRILLDELRPTILRQGVPVWELPYVNDYGGLTNEEKRLRIRLLGAALAPDFGCTPLLRIATTEEDEKLAKAAAAGLFWHAVPADATLQQKIKDQLVDLAGQRAPLLWIQEFVKSIDQPRASIDAFDGFVRDEQTALQNAPHTTDELDVLGPLRRYTIDLRMRASMKSEAVERTRDVFGDATEESPLRRELVRWLHQARYYDLLLSLAELHTDWFAAHRYEQYLVAAAARSMADDERSNVLLSSTFEAADSDRERLEVAAELRLSGHSDWAEREYRAVCEQNGKFVESEESLDAVFSLADMYHQQQRHQACYELLEAVCGQFEAKHSTEELNRLLGSFDLESTRLRIAYEKGLQALLDGDPSAAIPQFHAALPYAQSDNDVICDAYRLDNKDFRVEVDQRKQLVLRQHLRSMLQYEQALAQRRDRRSQQLFSTQVARDCNELAWLMINTDEDVETALRYAQRSVELDPGLAYSLDTLAVCHFKNGDTNLAIQYERQALRLMPYREDLQRTLKQLE